jgi:hypothetical protein
MRDVVESAAAAAARCKNARRGNFISSSSIASGWASRTRAAATQATSTKSASASIPTTPISGSTEKDGVWKVVPFDIIKDEDTPDRQPVLFINRHTGTGTPASNSVSSFDEEARDVRNGLRDRVPQPCR